MSNKKMTDGEDLQNSNAAKPEQVENLSTEVTDEELAEAGLNRSQTHVDFMVGTSDLEIIGTTHDGKGIPVFKNGNWAF